MQILEKLKEVNLFNNNNLYQRLNVVFGLFFLVPVLGFFYFGMKYDLFMDRYIGLFFLIFLIFSFLGFVLLRKFVDRITMISRDVSTKVPSEFTEGEGGKESSELNNIVKSFDTLERQFKLTFGQLEKRVLDVSVLRELSDLCYITFDPEELLYITLERAMKLTNSDIGSVMILERPLKRNFVVKASIGLGEHIKVGHKVDFATSVAKYAVINKSPLVVEDIEKDSRFGRANRPHYGTKSFICMPIKTINDIIGVLTISRRENEEPYRGEEVETLIPLVSNAAFTYENLRLVNEREQEARYLNAIERALKIVNSSIREDELLQAVLKEIQSVVPFDLAIIMTSEETRPDHLTIMDFMTNDPTTLSKGSLYFYPDSVIDRVVKQKGTILIDDADELSGERNKKLCIDDASQSCIMTSLETGGDILGVLVLAAKEPDVFRETEKFVEAMAGNLSQAIRRNILVTAFFKRNQELDTLKQIGNALASSTFNIDQVLKYTMDMIRAVMDVEAGSLLLLQGDELEFKVSFDVDVDILRKFRPKLGKGIAGYVAARGDALIVNDVKGHPQFMSKIDEYTDFSTRSALCVPIISQGKVLGVIEVLNKRGGDFVASDKDLLHSIASSVTIAMENARLYEETVSMAEQEKNIRQMFQKFVPEKIVDKIVHGRETERKIIEEIKMLTLLNIDIRGFSILAQSMGPQKTVSVLNYFFSIMGGIVFKHHGIVDKYLGDGFLAVFGAPVSSSRDADNAVFAALEMKEAIDEVNKYFQKEIGSSLEIGISVNTGEVIVGNIGFEKKMDYTVIGDPVNIVFRLQALTKSFVNSILISEKTNRAAQTRLDVREVEKALINSSLEGITIYELIGLHDSKRISQDD
jgi:class 3 adenylate cyclase/GAF domain-containing protein